MDTKHTVEIITAKDLAIQAAELRLAEQAKEPKPAAKLRPELHIGRFELLTPNTVYSTEYHLRVRMLEAFSIQHVLPCTTTKKLAAALRQFADQLERL